MSKKSEKEAERQESIDSLRKLLQPGDTVYTVLRGNPSASGMSRNISLIILNRATTGSTRPIRFITFDAAKVLEMRRVETNGHNAIRTGGCGMDMGFHLVYNLSRVLFPDWSRDGNSKGDGGYALNHEWL